MSNNTPENIRSQFKLIQGGLSEQPDSSFSAKDFEENELRESCVGKILQRYFEKLASESEDFRMPDPAQLSDATRNEIEYMANANTSDEFDFKKGPFLVDPNP